MTTYRRLPIHQQGQGVHCIVCNMAAGGRPGKRTLGGWVCKTCLEALRKAGEATGQDIQELILRRKEK